MIEGESDSTKGIELNELVEKLAETEILSKPKKKNSFIRIVFTFIIFTLGLGSGYLFWGNKELKNNLPIQMSSLMEEINPKKGFKLGATYGEVGPKLIAAGSIDLSRFEQLYQENGTPLTEKEIEILTKGSHEEIVITPENASFLLNYFWALGLTNKNPVLEYGPIKSASNGRIDGFASTGGWTIGEKPINDLFSSTPILILSEELQSKVEEVAKGVYRPCCDNPTHFPDCNHGMAMLGLLELMASQGATEDEMFQSAKYANAFWFPQQTLEQATYFKVAEKLDYKKIDANLIVSKKVSAGSNFQQLHQWLDKKGFLKQSLTNGSNCAV